MSDTNQSKVIFDRALFDAYLSLATQEGLLDEDAYKTDAYLARYKKNQPATHIKHQVLEQIILTPNILTTQSFPSERFHGHILNGELLTTISPPGEDLIKIGRFSGNIISDMLLSRGYSIPENEFEERLEKARQALNEADAYVNKTGEELPSLFSIRLREMLTRGGLAFDNEFSREEIETVERHQKAYDAAKPILDCMVEYIQLLTIAERENVLFRIPSNATPSLPVEDKLVDVEKFESESVALLRIVANKLGKLSTRDTLTESLELSGHPNTVALRKKIFEWKDYLSNGNIDKVEFVQKEVSEATSELSKLSLAKNIGRITTYLSVPVSMVELLLFMPPALGITTTLVGFGTQAIVDIQEKRYRWAMFGSS